MHRLLPLLLVLLYGCQTTNNIPARGSNEHLVPTTEGPVQGVAVDGTVAFKGIPFAAPPVDELRWRAPEPPQTRSSILVADTYGDFCAQPDSELLWFELSSSSEDCLTLNVWTPSTNAAATLPVMVWIHGGGYMQGSGNIPRLNSPELVKSGVVLVTINYRLNAFGFFAHEALSTSQASEPHANFGVLDSIRALEWIRDNVRAFGGDPENITIFGESAGGAMVNTLLVTPASEGLFHKAISQSSALGLAPDAKLSERSGFLLSGEAMGDKLVKALGIDAEKLDNAELMEALRKVDADTIAKVIPADWRFTPVIDNQILVDYSGAIFARGEQHDVPYITGGVSWEASLGRMIGGGFSPAMSARLVPESDKQRLYPALTGEALEDAIFGDMIVLAQARYVSDKWVNISSPAWHYHMTYVAEERQESQPGVAHADDIAFVMRTIDTELQTPTMNDRYVSDLMSAYWVQFARSGNPNHPDLPPWPEYQTTTQPVMIFGDQPEVNENFISERMTFHIARGEKFLQRAMTK